ncbi:MAG: ribosome small subunit-dependent GTPase A [Parachlamydiaceae bacterium]
MKEDNDPPSTPRRWIRCPVEEEYFGENRKEGKNKRKIAIAKDRSKYKKTDQEKYLRSVEKDKADKLSKQDWLEGRVLSIMPQGIMVEWEGELISCVLKGLLKKEKTQAKNLVAVGDFVLFEKTAEKEGIIGHIQPRRTILSRADNLSRRKEQLIAVNIDQVIITVSVVNPPLKSFIIDRYIIATRKGGMEPLIVVNKIDLLDNPSFDPVLLEVEKEMYEETIRAYSAISVPLISVSTTEGSGMEELKEAMRDKASVFSGPSGVGKSSLINLMTGLSLRTGEVVEKTKKGSHTTTTTQLIPLSFGGWCIDTPGIKSFGVWNLDREELEGYFPEIHEIGLNCKFSDCQHAHEESCAVQNALEEQRLSALRYESYQALRQSLSEEHVRR